jgi:hypothetical protein
MLWLAAAYLDWLAAALLRSCKSRMGEDVSQSCGGECEGGLIEAGEE